MCGIPVWQHQNTTGARHAAFVGHVTSLPAADRSGAHQLRSS